MSGRLRARAARLMRQLDAGAGYREQIERDLAKRLGERRPRAGRAPSELDARRARACATRERRRRAVLQELRAAAVDADAAINTKDTKDTKVDATLVCDPLVLCVLCVLGVLRAASRSAAQFADARSEADVRHPAAGRRSAERRGLGRV